MDTIIDIETVPCADMEPFVLEAKDNFKAPSNLTKDQAGADLGMTKEEIKFTGKPELIAQWEEKMAEKKAPEVAMEAWKKTSLNASYGRIVSIAWDMGDETGISINKPENERDTIAEFFDRVNHHASKRPPFFVGHNVVFDLKFIFRRAVILGLCPPFGLPFKGRHDHHYFCTMQAWCEYGERISLDNLASALGIAGKGDIDGSMVCALWQKGDYDAIAKYNAADVALTKAIYKKLTFQEAA